MIRYLLEMNIIMMLNLMKKSIKIISIGVLYIIMKIINIID
jgi:hypothetical protein